MGWYENWAKNSHDLADDVIAMMFQKTSVKLFVVYVLLCMQWVEWWEYAMVIQCFKYQLVFSGIVGAKNLSLKSSYKL